MALCLSQTVIGGEHDFFSVAPSLDGRPSASERLETPVVTQGRTLDEVTRNLREAVELHLEGEDLPELGLAPSPSILVTFELEAFPATA